VTTNQDAFTRLTVAAAQARHKETPPERADAALTVLNGGLPALPEGIEAMFATAYVQVPCAAISQQGRIAFLGIARDGRKQIVRIDPGTLGQRVVWEGATEDRVEHLHFPKGSDDEACVITSKDGSVCVQWGIWRIAVPVPQGDMLVGVSFWGTLSFRKCLVTYKGKQGQYLVRYDEGVHEAHTSKIATTEYDFTAGEIKILGHVGKRLAVLVRTDDLRSCKVLLLTSSGKHYWQSDWYDSISLDSLRIQGDDLSFVGWVQHGPTQNAAFLDGPSGRQELGTYKHQKLYRLPSGQMLVLVSNPVLNEKARVVQPLRIGDPVSGKRVDLWKMREVHGLGETSGLTLFSGYRSGDDYSAGYAYLGFVPKLEGGGWARESYTVIPGGHRLLGLKDSQTVVVSRRQQGEVRELAFIAIETVLEQMSLATGFIDPRLVSRTAPAYVPDDQLKQTTRGLMAWKFVSGTFYVIRYEL